MELSYSVSTIHPAMSESLVIHPTHRCFDDALELLEARVRHEPALARSNTLLLAHGIIRGAEEQADIGRVAHAWLEERRADGAFIVWDTGLWNGRRIHYSATIEEYYRAARVERDSVVRYTPLEVWQENKRSGHFGPWRPEFAALCRGGAR